MPINGTGWEDTTNTSCTNAPVNVTGQINFARAARAPKPSGTTLPSSPTAGTPSASSIFDHGDGVLNSLTTAPAERRLLQHHRDHHHRR